ncbi:zinc finger MYM-type protein 1-like [Iris pallida]|uniref:Zinc finger MYM-type protein 1-like n=1 Tax=Iris pallida TaxID=29817 RepID=A0AAX6IHZ5_IRIPA|nr:zinc finger MYM-type protein 1-like [Iris pallida]
MRLTSVPWSTILDYANKFVIIMLMNVIRFDVPISGLVHTNLYRIVIQNLDLNSSS